MHITETSLVYSLFSIRLHSCIVCTYVRSILLINSVAFADVVLLQPEGQDDTAFSKLVRTIQLIKQWAKRSPESELNRKDSFLKKFRMTGPNIDSAYTNGNNSSQSSGRNIHLNGGLRIKRRVINPNGNVLYYWLALVTVAVLYNIFLIIARETFEQLQEDYVALWITLDYLCDLVYVGDMVIQFFTGRCEITCD